MPKTYIAVDLETTGLEAMRDAIIEIGAVRFDQERILERFSTFVNPGRRIPPFITELTGIRDEDVINAISAHEATQKLIEFAGQDPVVGHNVQFDLAFLRRFKALQSNPAIDTFELAGILVPHASRYSLANLVRELGIDLPEQTHRALDDAEMTHALFASLMERAAQLPQDMLTELIQLGRKVRWGPVSFFSDALYLRQRFGFRGAIGAQLVSRTGGDAAGPLFIEDELPPALVPRREPRPIDIPALTGLLEPDGPIAEVYDTYEYRDQQVEMMQAVGETLNEGGQLLVEAGTGTGKSLAYLIPAVEWAVMNGQRVVISTNTINLQEQLAHKDTPRLVEALYEFRTQVLKGRSHYLCRQQFEALRRRGPMNDEEMRVLAKVMLWLPNTLDGDGDALFLPTDAERQVWATISAANEACDSDNCPFFASDSCFFYRARAKAEGAHLLIVNHALLLADAATQNRVLPEYDILIVDEAHHLERATTDSMQYSVSWPELGRAFEHLLRPSRGFPSLLDEISSAVDRLPQNVTLRARDLLIRLRESAERVEHYLAPLFNDIEMFLSAHAQQGGAYGTRLRVTVDVRDMQAWSTIAQIWFQITPHFATLVDGLTRLADGLQDAADVDLPQLDSARGRLLGVTRVLAAAQTQLHGFISEPDENLIYWLESRQRGPFMLHAVPLHVGPLIQEHLFAKKRSVILTSATLRIEHSFDYLKERLGVNSEARELALGSPFDYPSVALVYIVSDIPEPRSPGYQKTVDATLIDLLKATQGRTLVLFTSYSQLRATTEAITAPLASSGITVYAQGTGSSRAQLLESFTTGERVVLLGTRSFWEGVDVPGHALSCLVIVKLPFDVPDDPIVAARSEAYEDSFNEYMVPEAVLRFLQGFGRLIRTATDYGLAVVMDQRILTKRYGSRFLDSLPDPLIRRGLRSELPAVAKRWLAGQSLPATGTAGLSEDEPWSMGDESSEDEEAWFWGA
jgi:ATP-dependent DNA helicase DinG